MQMRQWTRLSGSVVIFLAASQCALGNSYTGPTLQVPGQYATIQDAINASVSGDTILVAPGTYTQSLNFNGKLIDVQSRGGSSVTTLSIPSGGTGVNITGAAEFAGFNITPASGTNAQGVVANGTGSLIKNNTFYNLGSGSDAAVQGNNASPILDGNVFNDCHSDTQVGNGVVGFVNGSSPVIENNVFENNAGTQALTLVLPSGNSPVVVNNTFVSNATAVFFYSFSNALIENNIFEANTRALDVEYPYMLPTFNNNLVWNNTTNYYSSGTTVPNYTGTAGNISANPNFVSSTNFAIQPNSPAINAGTSASAPDHDINGVPRPDLGGYDIGAYQVPEPSSLVTLGLCGLAVLRRRRTRQTAKS